MSARDEAEKRLSGVMDGTDWAKTDAIKGVGWALLHLADVAVEIGQVWARTLPPKDAVIHRFGAGGGAGSAEQRGQAGIGGSSGSSTGGYGIVAHGGHAGVPGAVPQPGGRSCAPCRAGVHAGCPGNMPDGDLLVPCSCKSQGHQL